MGNNSGDNTGDDTGAQRDTEIAGGAHLLGGLAEAAVNLFGSGTLHGKLGHGVRDLLEKNRTETRIETAEDAFLLHQARGDSGEAVGVSGIGHRTDTAGLQGAQEDIGDKLGARGGS